MTVTLSGRPADALDGDLAAKRAAIEDVLGDHSKVEILGGEIIVSPMARNIHLVLVQSVLRQLLPHIPEDWAVVEKLELSVDASNCPQPDLTVLPLSVPRSDLMATQNPSGQALLVVEVTSPSNGNDDRKWGRKYKAYAKGLVPVYLLIDPYAESGPTVTVFTGPNGKRYTAESAVEFGTPLRLPEPFDAVVIDSARFPARPAED
ncbi:Uma2 family endonuclease [Actinospica robiniae]|uniref:Uma2 family endonuclease n=1 Tax=Actinospica robiniae TaxID=304901 RepID=UPI000687BB2F|nr:Uma2 family endonuclease [Actinospica robiniae]